MANRIIELHDSEVSDVVQVDKQIKVRFSSAYVHESGGRAGVDPGKGFIQEAEMVIDEAAMGGVLPDFPVDISEGFLALNGVKSDNIIPIPFVFKGNFLMELVFVSGHRVTITGASATLSLLGSPKSIEDCPG